MLLFCNKYREGFIDIPQSAPINAKQAVIDANTALTTATAAAGKDNQLPTAQEAYSKANVAINIANTAVKDTKGILDNLNPKALEEFVATAKKNWLAAQQAFNDKKTANSEYNKAKENVASATAKAATALAAIAPATTAKTNADNAYNAFAKGDDNLYKKVPAIVSAQDRLKYVSDILKNAKKPGDFPFIAQYDNTINSLNESIANAEAGLRDAQAAFAAADARAKNAPKVPVRTARGTALFPDPAYTTAAQRARDAIGAANRKVIEARNALAIYQRDNASKYRSAKTERDAAGPSYQNILNNVEGAKTALQNAINSELDKLKKIADDAAANLTKVTKESDSAAAALTEAKKLLDVQQADYDKAEKAVPPLELVYNNAVANAGDATAKQTAYNDALAQQDAANKVLKMATTALVNAYTSIRSNLEKTFENESSFVKNAAAFPNTSFGIDKEYTTMSANWVAYTIAKTAVNAIEPTKVTEIATATDALFLAHNVFNTSKTNYGATLIKSFTSNTTDSTYVKNSKADADAYGLKNEYDAMFTAWNAVTSALKNDDAATTITSYNAYIPTKTAFANALLIAQGKKAEADFQAKLAAGRDAAAQWAKSGAKGCRNIQTAATTDPDMIDQDIACNDTEYISGYTKVTGFDAVPIGPNITKDNIAKYLAVKYSCCAAPVGEKGSQGKKGLPGLEGAPGADGPQGPAGILGSKGLQGPQGDSGPEGEKGFPGLQGDDGEDGCVGPDGRAGKSVKVPYIKHIAGPSGMRGAEGPRGPQGANGKAGIVKTSPVQPFTELDSTVALLNVQDKINKYRVS